MDPPDEWRSIISVVEPESSLALSPPAAAAAALSTRQLPAIQFNAIL